ncbi:hypothetical protein J1N35_045295 [Gossypium stocksii]|uniref:Uncharacterized protein n=1 Tax=Gossypium stocksii TaxID=47602 RepID=A0A9D3UB71_9ROSI|nr:hypothetical protein J1N35_045295 [Gossypium stocksii]
MSGKIHEKDGVSGPSNNPSYVTIRIKIPAVLAKAMKRKNQSPGEIDENGGDNQKKPLVKSKKSLVKKVGSMFANALEKKNSKDEIEEEMKKLKIMIENLDVGSKKTEVKINEECKLNDGVQPMAAAATGSENGEKAKPRVNEWPNSRRTYRSKRIDMELDKGKVHNVVETEDSNDLTRFRYRTATSRRTFKSMKTMAAAATGSENGEKAEPRVNEGPNSQPTYRSKMIDMELDEGEVHNEVETEDSNDLPRFRYRSAMKTMEGEEQSELCKKQILLGTRCRPLSHSGKLQYDE